MQACTDPDAGADGSVQARVDPNDGADGSVQACADPNAGAHGTAHPYDKKLGPRLITWLL